MNTELLQAVIGDALEFKCEHNVKTWIFDPPYNIGYVGYETITDSLSFEEYEEQMEACARKMAESTPDGSLFMINYPEQTARLLPALERAGWTFHQWISWVYPSNIGITEARFTTATRAVLWLVRGDAEFFVDRIKEDYKNADCKRILKRIGNGSSGRNSYDWWEINMRKNVSVGFREWANQLPVELVRRCIVASTNEGDVVGDLMAGSGTVYEVARSIGRLAVMNDIAPGAMEHWKSIMKTEPLSLEREATPIQDRAWGRIFDDLPMKTENEGYFRHERGKLKDGS